MRRAISALASLLLTQAAAAVTCPTNTAAPSSWTGWTGSATTTNNSLWTAGQIVMPVGSAGAGAGMSLFSAMNAVNCMFTDLYSLTSSAGGVTQINGAKVANATLPVAAIFTTSGTPSSTTYLRGDGVWFTPPGGSGATPGGNANDVQYNVGGTSLGGAAGIFSYNPSTGTLNLGGWNGSTSLNATVIPSSPQTATSAGVSMTVQGGPGGATSGAGGSLNLIGGRNNSTSSNGGQVNITGGQGGNQGGNIIVTAGSPASASNGSGGGIQFFAGNSAAASTAGNGGNVLFQAGSSVATTGGNGGQTTLNAGTGNGTGSGGSINISAGANGGASGAGAPGDVNISAGANQATNGVSVGTGNVNISVAAPANASTCATCGLINFTDSTGTQSVTIGPGYLNLFAKVLNGACSNAVQTAGTSFNITGSFDDCVIINGPTTFTVKMPPNPLDGEQVEIFNGGTATITLSVQANTGQTIVGGNIASAAFTTTTPSYKFQYWLSTAKWMRR